MPEVERSALADPAEPTLDLHLWLIAMREEARERWPRYDANHAFVIRAASSEQARKLAAAQCGDEGEGVWLDPACSSAEQLDGYGAPGIILSNGLWG